MKSVYNLSDISELASALDVAHTASVDAHNTAFINYREFRKTREARPWYVKFFSDDAYVCCSLEYVALMGAVRDMRDVQRVINKISVTKQTNAVQVILSDAELTLLRKYLVNS